MYHFFQYLFETKKKQWKQSKENIARRKKILYIIAFTPINSTLQIQISSHKFRIFLILNNN